MDLLLHHILRRQALEHPEKIALVCGTEQLTYAEVDLHARHLANGLLIKGLQPGDRVGVLLKSSIAQVLSIFAVSYAGGIVVPIQTDLLPKQIAHIANDCDMKVLITEHRRLNKNKLIRDLVSCVEYYIVTDCEDEVVPGLKEYDFKVFCTQDHKDVIVERREETDLVALLYTSGSTGLAKGVMITHSNILAGTSIVSEYLKISSTDRLLAVLPFTFDVGLNQLTTSFQQGATLVLTSFLFAKEIVQILVNERISGLAGVPTLWNLLLHPLSSNPQVDLTSLRYITSTGGVMPLPVLKKLQNRLPTTEIYLMYGLTEAFRSTYLPPEELQRRPTSMGKAIPRTEIIVVNRTGQVCKPGEIGELVHSGPTVSPGYWNAPEKTLEVFKPHPFRSAENGAVPTVCYSGDLVKTDEEGFLYFVGRRDAMIKSAGHRISPSEVEEVLVQYKALEDVAVIGVPDPLLGQHIKAFASTTKSTPVKPEAVLSYCANHLPNYMVPKSIELLDVLPKKNNGKIDYIALRNRENRIMNSI